MNLQLVLKSLHEMGWSDVSIADWIEGQLLVGFISAGIEVDGRHFQKSNLGPSPRSIARWRAGDAEPKSAVYCVLIETLYIEATNEEPHSQA